MLNGIDLTPMQCSMLTSASRRIPETAREAYWKDCADLLRPVTDIRNARVRTAIAEALRRRG
jgi:hypothetical protein